MVSHGRIYPAGFTVWELTMETASNPSAELEESLSPAQSLVPGLMTGVVFLIIAAVSVSMNGNAILLRQIAEHQDGEAGSLAAVAGTVRLHHGRTVAASGNFSMEPATDTVLKAQQLLADADLLTDVERATIEIPLADSRESRTGSRDAGRQLAQVLSRRMDALDLRAVIRVLRAEDLAAALDIAESMMAEGTLSADQIGIGIDAGMKADTITIEIVRSISLARMQERLL